ncbi:ComEC/Rec2 family competence protein [Caenispirillum bisanense]|uniref:ComEC/Rec2 family competence protein n=1 Tax=Caenispirillum bisanense TaxID=414052 RepID=UPI0031CF9FE3
MGFAALILTLAAVAAAWRRAPAAVALLLGLVAVTGGFAAAQLRSHLVAAPVLSQQLGPVAVTGTVRLVEDKGNGLRLTVAPVSVERLSPARLPATVRVTLRGAGPVPEAGETVRLRAVLMPPPAPSAPGGFNFPRQAWFDRLGAVGYTVAPAEILAPAEGGDVAAAVQRLRAAVAARLGAAIPGPEGDIAAALVTGARAAIPEATLQAYRDSGLAHLLSISGLHMTLAAGLVFVGVRALLAMVPAVALRWDVKKLTAAGALLAAAFYVVLSGAAVPSQRAFIMTAIVLTAVLVDRTAISLRTLAWAALAVLLTQPEVLVGPSFQMSFAAVTALVAGYELLAPRLSAWRSRGRAGRRWLRTAAVYVDGLMASTVLASLATAPFAAYHFNTVAVHSLAANLAAMPVVSAVVMPAGIVGLLAMPLGLEGVPLWAMGQGLAAVSWVAETVAAWPGATRQVPPLPAWGLAGVALGGLWLCLWRRPWRLAGLVAAAVAFSSAWWWPGPDILVNDEGSVMAVRGPGGGLILSPGRSDGFARDLWQERFGALDPVPWPKSGGATGPAVPFTLESPPHLACDAAGCIYRARGLATALVRDPAALPEDCWAADVIVASISVTRWCDHALAVIDRRALWRQGAHAIWLGPQPRVETVAASMGGRPWSPFRHYRDGLRTEAAGDSGAERPQ